MDAIAQPLQIAGYDFFLNCSIGVAAYPKNGADLESLLKHAYIATYRVKEMGSNNYQFYTAVMNKRAFERLRIEGDLHNTLERRELLPYYQYVGRFAYRARGRRGGADLLETFATWHDRADAFHQSGGRDWPDCSDQCLGDTIPPVCKTRPHSAWAWVI